MGDNAAFQRRRPPRRPSLAEYLRQDERYLDRDPSYHLPAPAPRTAPRSPATLVAAPPLMDQRLADMDEMERRRRYAGTGYPTALSALALPEGSAPPEPFAIDAPPRRGLEPAAAPGVVVSPYARDNAALGAAIASARHQIAQERDARRARQDRIESGLPARLDRVHTQAWRGFLGSDFARFIRRHSNPNVIAPHIAAQDRVVERRRRSR